MISRAIHAGGSFSPFGDLTTLMVWQKGKLALDEFPRLLIPAVGLHTIPQGGTEPFSTRVHEGFVE